MERRRWRDGEMASNGRRGKRRTERRNETLEGSDGGRRHRVTERFVVASTEDGRTDLRNGQQQKRTPETVLDIRTPSWRMTLADGPYCVLCRMQSVLRYVELPVVWLAIGLM
ncbi:unnamed protein product [Calypogeia fissa]